MSHNPRLVGLRARIKEVTTAREAELLKYDVSQDDITLALLDALVAALENVERASAEVDSLRMQVEL